MATPGELSTWKPLDTQELPITFLAKRPPTPPGDEPSPAAQRSKPEFQGERNTGQPIQRGITPPAEVLVVERVPYKLEVKVKLNFDGPTLTPKTSDETLSERGHQHDLDSEDVNDGETKTPKITEQEEAVRVLWNLYTTNVAKQCKSNCPMVRGGKCKCQANSDRVISDLQTFARDGITEEKTWLRYCENMQTMLNHFWKEHEGGKNKDGQDVCTPSRFGFGYEGLKLVQCLKKEEFGTERARYGKILEFQFRATLDEMLSEDCILGALVEALPSSEEVVARKLGIDLDSQGWYKDLYSNDGIEVMA